jgi:hypothetical protein
MKPLKPNLQVMILNNQRLEPLQSVFTLCISQSIDGLDVVADGENGFPACDRVGANDRVFGTQDRANVLRGAAGLGVQLKPVFFGGNFETRLRVDCCEALEEFLVLG